MSARSGVRPALRLSAMAAAVLAATAAWADERDDEIKKQTSPNALEVEAGFGFVDDDNTRFGQYNGMTDKGGYILLDGRWVRRDDATGTWMGITGRNLGLENRELRFEHSRQGNWGYFIDFGQTPRYSPYTPITPLIGAGTTTQTVNGGPAAPLELKTERNALAVGVEKWIDTRWDVRFNVRQEDKQGKRLFGSGGGTSFLTDPIDYTTQLYEATVGYTGDKAQFTGGYFGTNFENYKNRLNVIGSASGITPIALPPANHSHQLHFAGGYNFSPTTRGTYKIAYTHQVQDAAFVDVSAVNTRNNLGGQVDTWFGQVGLTAKPMPKLTVVADLRREDRDDKTPIVDYFLTAAPSTATGVNEPRSIRSTVAKLEGTYQLPERFRVTGGFDWDERKRNTSDVRAVSFRETTQENTVRIDLRRDMSETINGSIGIARSQRTGSDWYNNLVVAGTQGSNLVHPLHLADRDRNKLRGTLGWMPTDKLDLNFRAETSRDEYAGRALGLQEGSARFLSIDSGYRFGESWHLSAWVSHDDTRANLLTCMGAAAANTGSIAACPNTAASPIWGANMRNVGDALGLGVKGKATAQLEVGAEFQLSADRAEFGAGPVPAVAGVTSPPDVHYNRSIFKLSAKYALQKNRTIRIQYTHDRFSTDDWTWSNWTYTAPDGTRVQSNPQQTVNFIGITCHFGF